MFGFFAKLFGKSKAHRSARPLQRFRRNMFIPRMEELEVRAVPSASAGGLNIDWKLITGKEGGQLLTAYWPGKNDPTNTYYANSGVTLATGDDLGGLSGPEIKGLLKAVTPPIDQVIQNEMIGAAHKLGQNAQKYLDSLATPITLLPDTNQANSLDEAFKNTIFGGLRSDYDKGASKNNFQFSITPC